MARHSDVASPPYHASSSLAKSRPSCQFYSEGNGQRKFLLALYQLHLDEEALRETLEEQEMDVKAREEKIRQKQADDDEFFMEFGVMRIDSDYESSD
ncbi:hypothetical protein Tco_1049639 [Tanacetum coccineum]